MADNTELNAGTGGDVIASDDIGGIKHQRVKVEFGADGSATDVSSANPLPVRQENVISTDNSTATPLGVGANFTGTAEDVSQYSTVAVMFHSSHDSAADGMTVEWSSDGTNWDETHEFTYSATNGARHFQFPFVAKWFRVNYTNGGTEQTTFRVQTVLHTVYIGTTIHRLVDNVDPDRSATLSKSITLAQAAGSGDFVAVQATAAGNFKTSMEEINGVAPSLNTGVRDAGTQRITVATDDLVPVSGEVAVTNGPPGPGTYDTFGHLVTGHLNNQVDVQFFRDTPQNLTTVSVTGSGAAVSNVGGALFSSGVDTTASSKGVSNTNTIYRSGAEVYTVFTASFTAGVASSYQRIGLYDTNDGFFFGYEGTSFGVTVRNNASDVTTAQASFSDDDLTGGGSSLFTRDGTPEAIDPTKINVFRIRFGWLGSAPTCFEVMSPDGQWVIIHRILYPNLQTNPSIRNADLPVTLDISKTSAGATDLQMQTDCWGAGVTTNHQRLDDTLTDASLADLTRAVISAFNGTSFVNIQATNAGNLKMSLEEASDGMDIGAGNAGAETLRVSISTDDVNLSKIAGAVTGNEMQVDVITSALPSGASTAAKQLADGHNVTIDNGAAGAAVNIQDGGNTITIDAASLPLPSGAATATGQLADGHNVTIDNASIAVTGTVTAENTAGDIAHDAADSGNPVKVGGVAETTEQAAAADGDRVNFMSDLTGKQVVMPYAVPERDVDGITAAITGTSDTSVIAAPGAGLRNYITHILVTNSHASVGTLVEIKSATTVRYRGYAREDGGGWSVTLPTPLRLGDNEAMNAANITTGSNTYVSASGFIAP